MYINGSLIFEAITGEWLGLFGTLLLADDVSWL